MISKQQLNRLNKMLGDSPRVGYAPDLYNLGGGERQPQYKWCWAPDLQYPAQCGTKQVKRYELPPDSLLTLPDYAITEPVYHMVPQYPDAVWILARWEAPIGREMWKAKYGEELQYPERGQYIVTDVALSPGIEPNETATRIAIGAIAEQRARNLNDFINMAQERTNRVSSRHKNDIDAMVDDAILPVVPGMRGGARSQPLEIVKEFQ